MPADLAAIQRAFHDAITGAAPLASARTLVIGDGLHVYANAYFARIHGVLVEDYPKLAAQLGDAAFRALVVPYLRAYPTTQPSLREAGVHLARFLDDAWHADLARIERARVEAFDGPDATPLARADLAALPAEAFPALPLGLVPTAHLVELATNADELWDALEAGRPAPPRVEIRRTVLVWRRDDDVIHRTVEPDEIAPLHRIAAGAGFADICACVADDANAVQRALELLLRWLDAGVVAGA